MNSAKRPRFSRSGSASTAILAGLTLLAACATPERATIRNFTSPKAGMFTAGQPTEAQFRGLRAIGITRVICLRRKNETGTGWEEDLAPEVGIEFVRLPIDSKKDFTRANVERFAAEAGKPCDGGTLVCCGSSNRVGAMLALQASWLDGQSKDQALTLGRAGGLTKLEPLVRQKLSTPPK
ncbi:MAG: hypothetical protein NXI31_16140 [bacterium]|nr:hypothetical protein [bacterium]